MKRLMTLAVAVAIGASGGAYYATSHQPKSDPTWQFKVEDDYPTCWQTQSGVKCGPLSWSDGQVEVDPGE